MVSTYKIEIPTKPYLVKYFHALYGNPLIFSNKNYFGTTLLGYLNREFYMRKNEKIIHKKFDEFTTPLIVYLPKWWMPRAACATDIPPHNVILLNKHFEQRFEEDLVRYCYALTVTGMEIKDALEAFCKAFNISIDEDISFEGIKRKEYRCRMSMAGVYHLPAAKEGAAKAKQHVEKLPTLSACSAGQMGVLQLMLL